MSTSERDARDAEFPLAIASEAADWTSHSFKEDAILCTRTIPYGNYRLRTARTHGYHRSQGAAPVREARPSNRAGESTWPTTQGGSRLCYVEPLTPREQEVLDQLAHGTSNREIAGLLAISLRTVETHLSSIYSKLGVCGRTQAILWTVRERQEPWPAAVGLRDASHRTSRCFHGGGYR